MGLYVDEHNVFKTPKFGGFTNPINSGVDPGWALGGTLTIGPAGVFSTTWAVGVCQPQISLASILHSSLFRPKAATTMLSFIITP